MYWTSGDKNRVHGYVLSNFAKAEQNWLDDVLDAVADYAPLLLGMTRIYLLRVAEQTR